MSDTQYVYSIEKKSKDVVICPITLKSLKDMKRLIDIMCKNDKHGDSLTLDFGDYDFVFRVNK